MATSIADRPSFTYRTPRSKELHDAIRALWETPSIRRRVFVEAWSQIPIGFGLLVGSYLTILMTRPHGVWVLLLLAGIAFGGAAMGGLFHDANHGATFAPAGLSRRFDYVLAWLVSEATYGLSAYHWSRKHEYHHNETNLQGLDGDLDLEPLMRLHPASRMIRWFNRYQHWYVWCIYPMMPINQQILGHRIAFFGGKHGPFQIPKARGLNLVGSIAGPLIFYGWSVAIPVWQFGWIAAPIFVATWFTLGAVYGPAFQLAHCVDNVDFPTVDGLQGAHKEGYIHQLETTADFSPDNPVLSYFTAGLTHQVEHHIARRYPFPFYRRMAKQVLQPWCAKHGVHYNVNPTLWSALRAHARHLKKMGLQGRFVGFEMG